LFRNLACALIRSVRIDEDDKQKPKVPGRIITTLAKAKELRPYVEKLVTLARHARTHSERAQEFETPAERGSAEWKNWRESDRWNRWNQAVAPAVAMRRRAFAVLRDKKAVDILFDELAERFEDRPGGYTRVVRLAEYRLGDAGQKAIIEFVGERDRVRARRRAPVVSDDEELPAGEGERESTTAAAGAGGIAPGDEHQA
jgi:large subunit ribosomal protein L17